MKTSSVRLGSLTRVVAVLALLEFTSGVLQGYFTPMMSDIAQRLQVSDADVNWLESAQLPLAAIAVPVLAKLGDMIGHRRVLLGSTALTAAALLMLPALTNFTGFIIAWALHGVYSVWLPSKLPLFGFPRGTLQIGQGLPLELPGCWSSRLKSVR